MPSSSAASNRSGDATEQDAPATLHALPDNPPECRPATTLARGIVWADILAEIAADERARQLPDAA